MPNVKVDGTRGGHFRTEMRLPSVLRMLQTTLLALVLLQGTAAKSLDVLVSPWLGSHALNQLNVAEELLRRGHSVTILADGAIKVALESRAPGWQLYRALQDVKGFEVVWYDSILDDLDSDRMVTQVQQLPPMEGLTKAMDWILGQCHGLFTAEAIKGRSFDVFLFDWPFICNRFVPGNIVNITGGSVSTQVSGVRTVPYSAGELYFNPAITPAFTSQLTDEMTFRDRCINMLVTASHFVLHYGLIAPRQRKMLAAAGLPPEQNMPTHASEQGAVHLVTSHWGFEYPVYHAPNLINIGPLTTKQGKPIGGDLGAWMDSSPSGVVVVSLGTVAVQDESLVHAFAALAGGIAPTKLLWKVKTSERATAERLTEGLGTVMLVDWLPFNDVLAHNATRAAVIHCGMNGCQESMFHGVPVVGIPHFGDQFDNCAKVKRAGFGLSIKKKDVNEENVLAAVKRVLEEPMFAERAAWARRVSEASPGLEGAVRVIEHIGDVGVAHLTMRAAARLAWWQAYSLDTFGLFGFVAVAAMALLYILAKIATRVMLGAVVAVAAKLRRFLTGATSEKVQHVKEE